MFFSYSIVVIVVSRLANAKAVTFIKTNKTQSPNVQIAKQILLLKYLSLLSWVVKSVLKGVLLAMKVNKLLSNFKKSR